MNDDLVHLDGAVLVVFGLPAEPAHIALRPRSMPWRLGGAAALAGATALAAPVAFLVPPHAPWGIGVLLLGSILTRRRFTERFTIMVLEGSCPRCGDSLTVPPGTRLRGRHPIPCAGCRNDVELRINTKALSGPMPAENV